MSGDFAERYGPWAIVAGGSEGMGADYADRLAGHGINLLLVARKPGPMEALAAEVRTRHGVEVRTLSQDLMGAEAVANVAAAASGCDVGMLVYNAGSDTSFDYFLDRPVAQHEGIIMLNAFTPMRLTHHFAPAMAGRGKGGIILCSSIASIGGMPGNGVYSSAKAFMNNFAEMLWFELGKAGIDVLGVVLPAVRTPAMMRLGVQFDENTSESGAIVDEVLANLRHGPILDAGHSKLQAPALRAMPREQVVRALGAASEKWGKAS